MPGLVCSKEAPKAEGDVMGLSCPPYDARLAGIRRRNSSIDGKERDEKRGRERKLHASDSCPFPELEFASTQHH